jgi:hypothetical protein
VDCAAWQDLYDATNGPNWSQWADARSDPCSCTSSSGSVECTGGHITSL